MIDELSPAGVLMAFIGGVFAFWMVGYMNKDAGFVMKIVGALLTATASYFIASFISNG